MELQDDTLAVATRNRSSNSGSVDIFTRNSENIWQPAQVLYAGDGSDYLRIALDGNNVAIEERGKLHLYSRDENNVWDETAVFTGSDLIIRYNRLWRSDSPLPSPERNWEYNLSEEDNWPESQNFDLMKLLDNGIQATDEQQTTDSTESVDVTGTALQTTQSNPATQVEQSGGGGGFALLMMPLLFLCHRRRSSVRLV